MLFLCLRDRECLALAASVARSCFFPGSTGVVYLCSKVVDFCHWCHSTCPPSFADVTFAPSALPRSRGGGPPRLALPLRVQAPPFQSSFVVPLEEMCQKQSLATTNNTLGGAPQTLFGNLVFGRKPISCAVELCGRWLPTQKDLLCQWPSVDGKRLLCHCSKGSPYHVDALVTVLRSHRLLVPSRVRSMWQVYMDNLDVLEVCVWADLQELIESGQHECIVITRERYKRFQGPRSLGKAVIRAPQTKGLGDQIDAFQRVIGPPAVFVQELIHFTLATLNLSQVGRNWMQILAGRWVRVSA